MGRIKVVCAVFLLSVGVVYGMIVDDPTPFGRNNPIEMRCERNEIVGAFCEAGD